MFARHTNDCAANVTCMLLTRASASALRSRKVAKVRPTDGSAMPNNNNNDDDIIKWKIDDNRPRRVNFEVTVGLSWAVVTHTIRQILYEFLAKL